MIDTLHTDVRIMQGDVLDMLKKLPSKSVHMVCTSPPYWKLRDYGFDGQLGLERTPKDFIRNQVKVFRQVRRVLHEDGTLWMNMGDAHVTSAIDQRGFPLKGKMMMPHRLAIALQDDGWIMRQDMVWHKQQPQPETVHDRPTTAHEYFFLFSKSQQYYYDADAIAEACSEKTHARSAAGKALRDPAVRDQGMPGMNAKVRMTTPSGWAVGSPARTAVEHSRRGALTPKQNASFAAANQMNVETRNKRSVWPVFTDRMDLQLCRACNREYKGDEHARLKVSGHTGEDGAHHTRVVCECGSSDSWLSHFAAFGAEWIEPAILAGCPPGGTVLDCYCGTGTTLGVARTHGRKAIGIEGYEHYIPLIPHRMEQVMRRLLHKPAPAPAAPNQTNLLDLFRNPPFTT